MKNNLKNHVEYISKPAVNVDESNKTAETNNPDLITPDDTNTEKARNGDNLKVFMLAMIMASGLTFSSSANASIGSILSSLVDKFKDMFEPLLNSVMGDFGALLNMGQSETTTKLIQANAAGTDNIIQALQKIDDAKVRRSTAPAPDYCNSDATGIGAKSANRGAQRAVDSISTQSIATYSNGLNKGMYTNKIAGVAESVATNNNHLTLGANLQKSKLSSSADRQNALTSVEIMTAPAMNSISLKPEDAMSSNRLAKTDYLNNSSKAIRLELAKNAFFTAIAERASSKNGESKLSLIEKEVERTYGGEEWRKECNDLADPTPLLIEANKQMAFGNYVNVEILKKLEQQNLLLATATIQALSK
jgi:hypothetical protein